MIQLDMFPDILMGNDDTSDKKIEQNCRKKDDIFGMKYCEGVVFSGKWGIPMMDSYVGEIPETFITVSDITRYKNKEIGVTCFDSDNILERMWLNLDRYISKLESYKCVAEPDFSLKVGTPLAAQIANAYRNHVMAVYMQRKGINVLPSMSWSDQRSFEFCFDGYSKGGAVIVSTIGTLKDERSNMYFNDGFREMLKRVAPDTVVLYGDVNDRLMSTIPSQLEIRHIVHERFKRARSYGK